MKYITNRSGIIVLLLTTLACGDTEGDASPSGDEPTPSEDTAYGSCSIDGVKWSNYDYTAHSTDAASVTMVFVYRHKDYGLQEEAHPMAFVSADGAWDEWALSLDRVYDPADVVMGETTLFLNGDRDRLFLGLTEEGEVCDCWDPAPPWVLGVKDCSDYGGVAVEVG